MFKYAKIPALFALILMGIASAFAALQMLITRNLVDSVEAYYNNGAGVSAVIFWLFFMFCAVAFSSSRNFFNQLIQVSIEKNLTKNLIPMIMNKLKKTEYACFEDPKTHNLIERMSNNPHQTVSNCFNSVTGLLMPFFAIIGLVIYFYTISPLFTLAFGLVGILNCFLVALETKKYYQMQDRRSQEKRKMVYFHDLLINKQSLSELRVLGGAQYIVQRWKSYLNAFLKEYVSIVLKSLGLQLICAVMFLGLSAFMLFYVANLVLGGYETVGLFIAVLTGLVGLNRLVSSLAEGYNSFVSSNLSFRYFKDFLALPETDGFTGNNQPENVEIRFEDVCFKYPGTEREILSGVSFTLKQHERISIVGENGAGKSTIIKLLCGLYKPTSGKIYIGGKELDSLDPIAARKMFSVVFQDFGQYSLTLRENIALANLENISSDVSINDALKLAMGEELATKSELGIDVPLGKLKETGIDLSGGQWQRISIARAFFANSEFVILDEPTAALDPLAECKMYETFMSVLKNKGSITISHRLASAKLSDRILVISNGVISEQGTHNELMNLNGIYSEMFSMQAGWYTEGDVAHV